MNASFKFGVCTGSYEHNQILFFVYRIDEKKIAPDMTFSMIVPITRQLVILQLGWQRAIVIYDQAHDFLQCDHVVSARPGKSLPVFLKFFRMTYCRGSEARLPEANRRQVIFVRSVSEHPASPMLGSVRHLVAAGAMGSSPRILPAAV